MNDNRLIFALRLFLFSALIAVISYGIYLAVYGAFGQFQRWQFLFYTLQSNTLILLLFTGLLFQHLFFRYHRLPAWLLQTKIALTWAISITGLVWHLILLPEIKQLHLSTPFSPGLWLSFSLLHTWSPLLAFIDWFCFDKKGSISIKAPFCWLLIPLSYFIFICLKVHFTGPINAELGIIYPYPFIDFSKFGTAIVLRNVFFMMIGMTLLGLSYYLLDKAIKHLISKKNVNNTNFSC